jgi:hypothetical protein
MSRNAYSNTANGYFAILKCGIIDCCQNVSETHLRRYLTELDFHNNA